MLAHAEDVGAAGFVAVGLGHEGDWAISAPEDRAAKATGSKFAASCVGESDVVITPDEAARVGLAFLATVTRSAAHENFFHADGLSNFLLGEEAGGVRSDNAEHLVLNLGGAADALENHCGHDERVRKDAVFGEFQLASGDVSGKVERCDVRFAVSGGCSGCGDGGDAVCSVGESGNTSFVADLNLSQEHVSNGDFHVEETSEVALSCVRQDFLKAVFGSGEGVRGELAANARIGRSSGDLRHVVVESLRAAEVDFQVFARANVRNVDRHDFCADEKVLLVGAAFVDGLCDVSANCGGGE